MNARRSFLSDACHLRMPVVDGMVYLLNRFANFSDREIGLEVHFSDRQPFLRNTASARRSNVYTASREPLHECVTEIALPNLDPLSPAVLAAWKSSIPGGAALT